MRLGEFIKQSKHTKLNEVEKTVIRRSILNFVSKNPINYVPDGIRSYWPNSFFINFLQLSRVMTIVLVIALLTGSGIGFAAEKALPGDALYPVKIGLNEEVRGWLAVSPEAKANWEINRVQRRLEEAEKMATQGSLSVEVRERVEANFEAHSNKIRQRIKNFESKDDFDSAASLSAKFEMSLRVHQEILGRLASGSKDNNKKEIRPIESRIQSEVRDISELRRGFDRKKESDNKDGTKNKKSEKLNEKDSNTEQNNIDSSINSTDILQISPDINRLIPINSSKEIDKEDR